MKKLNGSVVEISLVPEVIDGIERIARASLSEPDEIINRVLLNHVRSAEVLPRHSQPSRTNTIDLFNSAKRQIEQKNSDGGRKYLMRTPEMFQRGLIVNGDRLRLKGLSGHEAYVHDEKHVMYRGEVMTYNAWGMKAHNIDSINIYVNAILDDGRTLDDLRPENRGRP